MSYIRFIDKIRIPNYYNMKIVTTGKAIIDEEKCNGCGLCTKICPGRALGVRGEGKEKKAYMLDEEVTPCVSCNCCYAICKKDAICSTTGFDFNYYYKQIHRGAFELPRKYT